MAYATYIGFKPPYKGVISKFLVIVVKLRLLDSIISNS